MFTELFSYDVFAPCCLSSRSWSRSCISLEFLTCVEQISARDFFFLPLKQYSPVIIMQILSVVQIFIFSYLGSWSSHTLKSALSLGITLGNVFTAKNRFSLLTCLVWGKIQNVVLILYCIHTASCIGTSLFWLHGGAFHVSMYNMCTVFFGFFFFSHKIYQWMFIFQADSSSKYNLKEKKKSPQYFGSCVYRTFTYTAFPQFVGR